MCLFSQFQTAPECIPTSAHLERKGVLYICVSRRHISRYSAGTPPLPSLISRCPWLRRGVPSGDVCGAQQGGGAGAGLDLCLNRAGLEFNSTPCTQDPREDAFWDKHDRLVCRFCTDSCKPANCTNRKSCAISQILVFNYDFG